MTMATPEDLLVHELKDLYYVEKKLVKVLGDVAGRVQDVALAKRLREHSKESNQHAERIEQAFDHLGMKPVSERCPGFEGIKQEHDEFVSEEKPSPEMYDLFVAGAAGTRIEHYEIAGYMSAIALAESCGKDDIVSLLRENLLEEEAMLADSEAIAKDLPALTGITH